MKINQKGYLINLVTILITDKIKTKEILLDGNFSGESPKSSCIIKVENFHISSTKLSE